VNHLNVGLGWRMEQLRQAHLDFNKALHANNEPFDNPYAYIIGFEIRAGDCSKLADDYLHLRQNSPASSVHSSQPSGFSS
jgi:hypothetical protein